VGELAGTRNAVSSVSPAPARRPPPVTFKYSTAAAIVLLGATIFLLRSVAGGQASVLVPIAQMGFVVAALLAR